jgi:hypothetical protein
MKGELRLPFCFEQEHRLLFSLPESVSVKDFADGNNMQFWSLCDNFWSYSRHRSTQASGLHTPRIFINSKFNNKLQGYRPTKKFLWHDSCIYTHMASEKSHLALTD